MNIDYCGEEGIICNFGDKVSENISSSIVRFSEIIKQNIKDISINLSPTAILIQFDNTIFDADYLIEELIETYNKNTDVLTSNKKKKTWNIPVCYDKEFSLDLERICDYTRLMAEKVIEEHCKKELFIYCYGGFPGIPRLGETELIAVSYTHLTLPTKRIV